MLEPAERISLLQEELRLSLQLLEIQSTRKLFLYYPEEDFWGGRAAPDTPLYPARYRYKAHLEFFRLGRDTFARMFQGSVGSGKTEAALYELSLHCRGWYPPWWEGMRYNRPLDVWVSGRTSDSVRDILQTKWLGEAHHEGTGILPREWIDFDTIARMSQPSGAIDTFAIKNVHGGLTRVGFKSCKEGVLKYVGTDKDIVLFDEPTPVDIYSQGVGRTRNRSGARIMFTVAPIEGNTGAVRLFRESEDPSRRIIRCHWKDVPHLTEEWKRNTLANTPAYLREVVQTGEPTRGAGAVYPVREEDIIVKAAEYRQIPSHFRWIAGFDGGPFNTAYVLLAYDKDRDTVYVVNCFKGGILDKTPDGKPMDASVHATRMKARNMMYAGFDSVPIEADAGARNATDGEKLIDAFRNTYGMKSMQLADKRSVDAGTALILEYMNNGRFKVLDSNEEWLSEFRDYSYEYDEDTQESRIRKQNDHLLDATRYAMMRLQRAKSKAMPALEPAEMRFG